MRVVEQPLPRTYRIRLNRLIDIRGCFVKTYSNALYSEAGIQFEYREEYYSVSKKDVIRGMHFQTPPHEHDKIVYCAVGAVQDVLLDLRPGGHYGQVYSLALYADTPEVIVIPKGVAHGFQSLTDDSLMIYKTSAEYAPQNDMGIRWDSFGFSWAADAPLLSERDSRHPAFSDFTSPFGP